MRVGWEILFTAPMEGVEAQGEHLSGVGITELRTVFCMILVCLAVALVDPERRPACNKLAAWPTCTTRGEPSSAPFPPLSFPFSGVCLVGIQSTRLAVAE